MVGSSEGALENVRKGDSTEERKLEPYLDQVKTTSRSQMQVTKSNKVSTLINLEF